MRKHAAERGRRRVVAGALVLLALGASGPVAVDAASAETATSSAAGIRKKIVGMSAPDSLWSQRLREVDRCGVEARRIYADLQPDGQARATVIREAVRAGMMPVISYKVPSVRTLIAGGYDSWLKSTRRFLSSLGVKVTATFWHEPYPDLSGADFVAGSRRFLDRVQAPRVKVGPIINGFLLDRQKSTFKSYTSRSLLRDWNFVAVDSYQGGTAYNPGPGLPARAVPILARWLDRHGRPNKRIGIGEYNGFSGEAMREAGETILSTPEVWFALAWNSSGEDHSPLTGARLKAYRATKADPRARNNVGC